MYGNLTSVVTVRRRSALIVEPAAAGLTLSVARQPVRESVLEVTVTGGQAGSGQVTVQGLSAGTTQTETLVYTAPGIQQTTRLYTTVAGATTSGLHNESPAPTVQIRAVGRDGSPQHAPYTVIEGWPAAVQESAGSWSAHPGGGSLQDGKARIMLPWAEHWAPREGDLVDDDQGRTWQIEEPPPRGGASGVEFWRLKVKRYQAEP